jgi:hypothetical protein
VKVIHEGNVVASRAASPKRLRPATRATHFRPVHLPTTTALGIPGGGLSPDPPS